MATEIRHVIDGRQVAARSGRLAPVVNPATGEETGRVALASAEEMIPTMPTWDQGQDDHLALADRHPRRRRLVMPTMR